MEPRQKKKNKISNFGTFFLYTQILNSLSLNLKKDQLYLDYPIICVWHFTERIVYIYNRSPMYFHFYHVVYVNMLSFQLLVALHYLA